MKDQAHVKLKMFIKIEFANGQIIVIYDADLTVSFEDINFAINILNNSNADFINCTRMIYPQKEGYEEI